MANEVFGCTIGAFFGWRAHKKLNSIAANSYAYFRKPFMKIPIPAFFFFCGYYGARQLRARILGGRKPLNMSKMSGDSEVLSSFRNEEQATFSNGVQLGVVDYLMQNSDLSRTGIMDAIFAKYADDGTIYKYRIKRTGPDADPHKWLLGKIHGLENLAYLDDETIEACSGNPVKLQMAINNVIIPDSIAPNYEDMVKKYFESLKNYKNQINKLQLFPSDRKKMLALPFYLQKRRQNPEPKPGQW